MRNLLLVLCTICCLAGIGVAQDPAPKPPAPPPPAAPPPPVAAPCPTIVLEGPGRSNINVGETLRYTARVDTKERILNLDYRWNVNPEVVYAGEGSSVIEFERPRVNAVTVRLDVAGMPDNCQRNAAQTSSFDPIPTPIRLDQFPGPLTKITDQRFNRIAAAARSRPDSILYIVIEFATAETEPAAKQKAALFAGLAKTAGLEEARVSYVLGKTTRERLSIYLVPPGADYPVIDK